MIRKARVLALAAVAFASGLFDFILWDDSVLQRGKIRYLEQCRSTSRDKNVSR
jgi:hypothetical protein